MRWDDVKVALAVAREGTYQGAAELLRTSHTTVGRRIAALEARLKAELFDRRDGFCQPTEAGRALIAAGERMEEAIGRIGPRLEATSDSPEGTVQITTMLWIAKRFLLPELPAFRDRYPRIRFFFCTDVLDYVRMAGTDNISLRFELQPSREEVEKEIAHVPFAAYRSTSATTPPGTWVSSHGGRVTFRPYTWIAEAEGDAPDLAVLGTDAEFLVEAVRLGIGYGYLPMVLAEGDPTLERVPGLHPRMRVIRALMEHRSLDSPHVRAVTQWLETALGGLSVEARPAAQ
ncbi:LysR family transcriptional regulator [Rhodobacteraceae bacterium CCMM004]|nr:LysR family transcriptional regulator [Rhodobacteraceae bacterium CCMM004]